jgi:hypothetical protein
MTGANELQVPIIISEQYPKGLGKTIPELDVSLGKVFEVCFLLLARPPFHL